MTTDHRFAVAYTLYHPPADPGTIRPLIERLRKRAIDLGFLQVGDLVFLQGDDEIISHEYGERFLYADPEIVPAIPTAVCYFVARLPDSDPLEAGLAFYSCEVQIDGQAVGFGLPYWMWTGTVRTRDLKNFSLLLHHAAEFGIQAAASFAGITMIYSRDEAGGVKIAQEWDEVDDDG